MSVKCGNREIHGAERVEHETVEQVRNCFALLKTTGEAVARRHQEASRILADREMTPLTHISEILVGGTLHEGTFTVNFEDGKYRTLRVRRQGKDSSFKPGILLVAYLNGSDNTADYKAFAQVREYKGRAMGVRIWMKHQDNETLLEAVRVLCEDPQAAATAYAEESGCCSRCGRQLTVPASIHCGLGPVCASKVAA